MRPSLPAQGAGLQEEIRQVVNSVSSLLTLVVGWGSSSLQDQKEIDLKQGLANFSVKGQTV